MRCSFAHEPRTLSLRGPSVTDSKSESKTETKPDIHTQMLISYTPGEECRVAVVENGKLVGIVTSLDLVKLLT